MFNFKTIANLFSSNDESKKLEKLEKQIEICHQFGRMTELVKDMYLIAKERRDALTIKMFEIHERAFKAYFLEVDLDSLSPEEAQGVLRLVRIVDDLRKVIYEEK